MNVRLISALVSGGLATAALSGCASTSQPAPKLSTPQLAQSYLAIASPANKILDKSFDALEDSDDDVAASVTLLRTIAATEHGFDRALKQLALPGPMGVVAAKLIKVNEARADLTARAAHQSTVDALARAEVDIVAMNVPVEAQVRELRSQLGLPPPDTD